MQTPQDRANAFKVELDLLLKKYNLQLRVINDFPQYRILPDEVKLALKVLDKNGVQYQIVLQEAKNATI